MVAASQTTADIQATFTESGDEPSNSTGDGALSLTTESIPSTTYAVTTEPTSDGDTAANLIPSGQTPTSDDNETVSEELGSEWGDAPSSVTLVSTSDDPPSTAAQTDIPPMAKVALDLELSITPEQPIDLARSPSRGSIIAAPAPTELTVLTEDSHTNPLAIVRYLADQEVSPVDINSTPSLREPSNLTWTEVTETRVGGIASDLNMDDPPPLVPESRGSELAMITLSPIVGETPDTTSGSTLPLRVLSNSTLVETTESPVDGITPDLNTDHPLPLISENRGSELTMVATQSLITDETPDTTSVGSRAAIGTGDDAPSTPIHHDGQKPNILFFGETGAGKSSVINMLMNGNDAVTSSGADGKTSSFESFLASIDGQRVRLWDTAGLNEAERGTVPAKVAKQNLWTLASGLREGITLLVYCVRATRFRPKMKDNYNLVHGRICKGKVPIFIVITGLENEVPMDAWWVQNEAEFSRNGMSFDGHACVTSTRGKRREGGGHMYDTEFRESQVVLRRLIKDYFATPRTSWTVDPMAGELETSSTIDNHGVDTNVGGSDRLPAPPAQSWWEYARSFF